MEMPLRAFESVLVWYPLGSLPIAKTVKGYCQRNMRLDAQACSNLMESYFTVTS
jgi:hypothetical protein